MKRGTPDHPKMRSFARALGVSRSHAVGIMECLWHFTSNYAPNGSLARFTPEEIAEAIDWDHDPSKLISALKSGWLDEDLFVHDWPAHCEDAVHMRLARAGQNFACGCTPKTSRLHKDDRCACAARAVCARHAHGVRAVCALPRPKPTPRPTPNTFDQAKSEQPELPLASLASSSDEIESTTEDSQETEKPDMQYTPEQIYTDYPRKVGKDAAVRVIAKVLKSKSVHEASTAAGEDDPSVFLLKKSQNFWLYVEQNKPKFFKGNECYVPHPATWFRQGRYMDEDFCEWEKKNA